MDHPLLHRNEEKSSVDIGFNCCSFLREDRRRSAEPEPEPEKKEHHHPFSLYTNCKVRLCSHSHPYVACICVTSIRVLCRTPSSEVAHNFHQPFHCSAFSWSNLINSEWERERRERVMNIHNTKEKEMEKKEKSSRIAMMFVRTYAWYFMKIDQWLWNNEMSLPFI